MGYWDILLNDSRKTLESQKQILDSLQQDEESKKKNKKQIAQIKKKIKSIQGDIKEYEGIKSRQKKVEELEKDIPEEIKQTFEWKFASDGYVIRNTAPHIGNITVDEAGRVVIKHGGLDDVDDGKMIIQLKDGEIYIYEDRKAYDDYNKGENLVNLIVRAEKTNVHTRKREKFSVNASKRGRQWSYQENDLFKWKNISDISELPIQELLTEYSISEDLQQFLNENFIAIPKKEQVQKKDETHQQVENIITGEDILTIDDLKKEYTYVLEWDEGVVVAGKVEKKEVPYTVQLADGTTVQKTREENGKKIEYYFFKDSNGIVTPIPELNTKEEGNIEKGPFTSSSTAVYSSSRKGTHTYDVREWGFDHYNEEGKQVGRFDKHSRYVTLDESQKIVKVFESDKYIDKPWTNLYHRNKDENGKQCIRLVDLAGNIHSIKEGGKVGEKGLKEKTFGPRGDYQLKVVYKDKEPVYAIFMGSYSDIQQYEFCTAEELKELFERQKREFQRYGMRMDEDSCFANMEEIIETFNDTFMQGNFVPALDKTKTQKEEKSVTELAEELSGLTKTEQEAKQLLSQYEQQLPDNNKQVGED